MYPRPDSPSEILRWILVNNPTLSMTEAEQLAAEVRDVLRGAEKPVSQGSGPAPRSPDPSRIARCRAR